MATAAGSTHPTGMRSCLHFTIKLLLIILVVQFILTTEIRLFHLRQELIGMSAVTR